MKFLGPEFISGRTGSSGSDMATTAIPLFPQDWLYYFSSSSSSSARMEDGGWTTSARLVFLFSGSLGLSHSSTGKSRLLECSLFEVTCCLVHYYIDNIFSSSQEPREYNSTFEGRKHPTSWTCRSWPRCCASGRTGTGEIPFSNANGAHVDPRVAMSLHP